MAQRWLDFLMQSTGSKLLSGWNSELQPSEPMDSALLADVFDSFESFDVDARSADLLAVTKPHSRIVRLRDLHLERATPEKYTVTVPLRTLRSRSRRSQIDSDPFELIHTLPHPLETILVTFLSFSY